MNNNVRFFLGVREQYDNLTKYNPLALYFCTDTGELYRGRQCLSAGVRLVDTLPECNKAAEGILYYISNTKEGYVLAQDRTTWVQVISNVDFSSYYTKDETRAEIATAISEIKVPTVKEFVEAISGTYALKSELPTKISQLENDSNYLTSIPGEYITKTELDSLGYIADVSDKADKVHSHDDLYEAKGAAAAIKNELLNGAGDAYDTLLELGDLIDNNQEAIKVLETIATSKADKLHTHQEYLTEHQDLSNYAKKSDIPDVSSFIKEIPSEYITETELDSKGYLKVIPEEYVTQEELVTAIASIEHPAVNLENYVTKDELKDVVEKIPDEYITESDLEAKGYLTEHQDISHLATKAEIPDVSKFITEIPEEYAKTKIVVKQKYEILPIAGMLVSYNDTEVRLNTQHIEINSLPQQNAGDGSSDKYYYATFRAYAPEGATSVVEGSNDKMDSEHSKLAVDNYGRKYTTIWSAIANKVGDTWSKFGDRSTVDKYIGFYYNFHWYNDDLLIGTDKVRVILTNDSCHNDLVPDAVARRIDDKINAIEVPEVPVNISAFTNDAGYITKADVPEVDISGLATLEQLVVKADNILFVDDKFVTNPVGSFAKGDSVKDLTIAKILAKLLGLSDEPVTPDEPDIPVEPESVVDTILLNKLPMYAINTAGLLAEVPYKYLAMTEQTAATEATEQGFYQIKDAAGNVIESGYQELQINHDEVYYIIALPKIIDYNTMISIKVWSAIGDGSWVDAGSEKPMFTSDPNTVGTLCDEAGIDISHIDTTIYTVWALEATPDGSKYRFVINE